MVMKEVIAIMTMRIIMKIIIKPLIHGQINLINLIWHIFWIKNCSIKFDVYTIKLVWIKLIKLVSKKWTHLTHRCHPTQLHFFCCLKIFWVPSQCTHFRWFAIDSTTKFHVESLWKFHRFWKANPRGNYDIDST